jgi:hypothetical protein
VKYLIILETANETALKVLRWWVLKQTGIVWEDCQIERAGYDVSQFAPTVALITLDPYKLTREITPLTLVQEDFRKARDFVASGERVMVLCGGKVAKEYLGYGQNANKIRGHYAKWPIS